MSILVRNLPREVSEEELRNLFLPYGEIISCDLVNDKVTGQSKGFGFVEMDDQEQIENAISALNGSLIKGQKIRVKWSNQEKHQQFDRETTQVPTHDVWANAKPKSDD